MRVVITGPGLTLSHGSREEVVCWSNIEATKSSQVNSTPALPFTDSLERTIPGTRELAKQITNVRESRPDGYEDLRAQSSSDEIFPCPKAVHHRIL